MKTLILIIEDDKPIQHFMKVSVETQDYRCIEADNGKTGLLLIASQHPDLVILDLGLPDMDGIDLIKKVREWSRIPIIVVSARGQDREKVTALDLGADDYLTKPFSVAELLARIRVALRHAIKAEGSEQPEIFTTGDLTIDFEKRKVFVRGSDIHLTPTEYRLLSVLARHCGKVLTHRFLIEEIWGIREGDDTQSLRVCMGNLRRKIEKDMMRPEYVVTEIGVGYRMVE
jgi:two-component system KDP operon response regulator KdpE